MTNDQKVLNNGEGPDVDILVQSLTNTTNEAGKFENFVLAMNRTFDQLTTKLDDAIGQQARIEGSLDRIEGKLDRIEGSMDRIEKLLDGRNAIHIAQLHQDERYPSPTFNQPKGQPRD